MMENYLTLLEESLQKKIQVLEKIQAYNLRQQELFQKGNAQLDRFDEYVAEKGALIEELTALDNGFEILYARVAEELKDNREKYAQQIKNLQELVAKVTESGVTIEAQEARNKQLIENYFSKRQRELKNIRTSSKAAYDYYKNMNNTGQVTSQYLDRKK